MEQGNGANVFVTDREREYLSKLCWLLHDAGTLALRTMFNSVHPGISLKEHLRQHHIRSVLTRLHQQKALSEKQWGVLYPTDKGGVSSQNYDSRILVILLQTVCHLSPPYPNGWSSNPLPTDTSFSADVVRLQILLQQIGSLVGVRGVEYPVLWRQIVEVLLRHGGIPVQVKIQRIDNEQLPPDQQNYYIQQIKNIWGTTESGVGALKHLNGPRALNKPSKGSRRKTDEQEGLSLEDKVVLSKMYRLLMDNIVVDDIIDRLQQGQIIKITDRQEIITLTKNSERMQYILTKIQNSKSPYALKLLLDALKFKYSKIYEEVTDFRRITYKHGVKETRDLVGLCTAALKARYNDVFSKCCPFPWNDNLRVPIKDYYTQTEIIHSDGNKVHLNEILPLRCSSRKGTKVVLEGESGSGKSTLASMIAYQWATAPAFFEEHYRFLVLVDTEVINGNAREGIYNQTMTANSKVSCDEFWATLEHNAQDVVFLIDGFTSGNTELNKIIDGTYVTQSSVIVLVSPTTSMSRVVKPDYKLFNVGLNLNHITRCLKIYAGMIRIGSDDFDMLLEDLEFWSLGVYLRHPFICFVITIIYKFGKLDLKSLTNLSSVLETYITALATQFCKKQHLTLVDEGYPVEVKELLYNIEKLSLATIVNKKTFFHDGELMGETLNTQVMKFGLFQRSLTSGLIKGHCCALTSLLAARYLVDLPEEELKDIINEKHILNYTKYSMLIAYTCGLFTLGEKNEELEGIFLELAQIKKVTKSNPVAEHNKYKACSVHLVHLNQSLQSLMECPNNTKVTQLINDSFPTSICVHKRGLYPIDCLRGFSAILRNGNTNLVQFDMAMHPYYLYQEDAYLDLASALSDCSTLKVIKATWSRPEMMSKFLAAATRNKPHLDLVQIDASRNLAKDDLIAITWDDLQSFCENLENTTKFVFRRCVIPQIVGHVLKCLPKTISDLDFTDTSLNLICASELASHLEHSSALRTLNLSNTELVGSSVVALSHGLKLNNSLQELRLCGTQFDRSSIWALSQALRLVNSLSTLDLERCSLTQEMCHFLGLAITENGKIKSLIVSSDDIPPEGKSLMKIGDNDLSVVIVTNQYDEVVV